MFRIVALTPNLSGRDSQLTEPDFPEANIRDIHFSEYKLSFSLWKKLRKDYMIILEFKEKRYTIMMSSPSSRSCHQFLKKTRRKYKMYSNFKNTKKIK